MRRRLGGWSGIGIAGTLLGLLDWWTVGLTLASGRDLKSSFILAYNWAGTKYATSSRSQGAVDGTKMWAWHGSGQTLRVNGGGGMDSTDPAEVWNFTITLSQQIERKSVNECNTKFRRLDCVFDSKNAGVFGRNGAGNWDGMRNNRRAGFVWVEINACCWCHFSSGYLLAGLFRLLWGNICDINKLTRYL